MATYISLLRGINVLGRNRVEMGRLREMFEGMGFERVRTYINSGNVVFSAGRSATAGLSKRIEERMVEEFGFGAMVITRTATELGRAMEGNPFVKESRMEPSKVFVGFMARVPKAEAVAKMKARAAKTEQAHCGGREIYVYYVGGMGQAKLLTHGVLERVLAVSTTMRNWNTVSRLYEMAGE